MNAFAAAARVLFRDPHLSLPASYFRDGAGPVETRVILRSPDEVSDSFGQKLDRQTHVVRVLAEAVASPTRGDHLTVTTRTGPLNLQVIGSPRADSQRLVHECPCREVADI